MFIDNALSHPGIEELVSGDIKVKFSPPNVTALWQPMDQGVLENITRVYMRQLLRKLIEEEGEDGGIEQLKSINVKDVYIVASAWDHVAELTIKISWKKYGQLFVILLTKFVLQIKKFAIMSALQSLLKYLQIFPVLRCGC